MLLINVLAERIKGVFITGIAVFGYDATLDALKEIELDDCFESRIEIISESIDGSSETQLLECIELLNKNEPIETSRYLTSRGEC